MVSGNPPGAPPVPPGQVDQGRPVATVRPRARPELLLCPCTGSRCSLRGAIEEPSPGAAPSDGDDPYISINFCGGLAAKRPELLAHHWQHAGQLHAAIAAWRQAGDNFLYRPCVSGSTTGLRSRTVHSHKFAVVGRSRCSGTARPGGVGPSLADHRRYWLHSRSVATTRARTLCEHNGDIVTATGASRRRVGGRLERRRLFGGEAYRRAGAWTCHRPRQRGFVSASLYDFR